MRFAPSFPLSLLAVSLLSHSAIAQQTNEIETVKETIVTESKPTVELKKENTIKDKNIAPKAELKKKELKTKKK